MIKNLEEREWLAMHFENLNEQTQLYLTNDKRKQIAELLIKSQAWDHFMATKYPTVKRYGGEGAESLMAFFWQLLHNSVEGIVFYNIFITHLKNNFYCSIILYSFHLQVY